MVDGCEQRLTEQLRADLRLAMRGRDSSMVATLRTLLAAVENAQAVPVGALHERYVVREFGDAATEVPRRRLSCEELHALLAQEIASRRTAAEQYRQAGREEQAEALLREAETVAGYLPLAPGSWMPEASSSA